MVGEYIVRKCTDQVKLKKSLAVKSENKSEKNWGRGKNLARVQEKFNVSFV